jgi:hypothetical protein
MDTLNWRAGISFSSFLYIEATDVERVPVDDDNDSFFDVINKDDFIPARWRS